MACRLPSVIARAQHTITIAQAGNRLDRFLLAAYPWLNRATLADLFTAGHVLLNQRSAAKGVRLAAGDTLLVRDLPEPSDLRLQPNPKLPLVVLYEDDHVLALDKPAGLPTHPLRFSETNTLANALIARFPGLAHVGPDRLFPAILHRLDTQTSGLLLAAKTPAAYANLRAQFRRCAVEKEYTALVHGRVSQPGRLDAPLTHQTRTPCKMTVARNPAKLAKNNCFPAVTSWTPRQVGHDRTLLAVTILTGVTHQIRCHLAHAGHPIVGDTLYGSPTPAPRHWLHATGLRCTHPATGHPLALSSPLPPAWPALS